MKGPFAVGDKVHVEFTVTAVTNVGRNLALERPNEFAPEYTVPHAIGCGVEENFSTIVKHIPAPLSPHKAGDKFRGTCDVEDIRTIIFIDSKSCMYEMNVTGQRYMFRKADDIFPSIRWPV